MCYTIFMLKNIEDVNRIEKLYDERMLVVAEAAKEMKLNHWEKAEQLMDKAHELYASMLAVSHPAKARKARKAYAAIKGGC